MELKIDEKELYQAKVRLFQKEINELSEKHGLFLVPTIAYSDTGIVPTISIIPKTEEKKEEIKEIAK